MGLNCSCVCPQHQLEGVSRHPVRKWEPPASSEHWAPLAPPAGVANILGDNIYGVGGGGGYGKKRNGRGAKC